MSFLKTALTRTTTTLLVATICAISGAALVPEGLKNGVNPDAAKKFGFDDPPMKPDFVAARALLQGTPASEAVPVVKKGAKVEPKVAIGIKNELVYYLATMDTPKKWAALNPDVNFYETRNRIALALGALGFGKLAEGIINRLKPVKILDDGDVLVVETPPGYVFGHEARKVGLTATYHGDPEDKKWAKNPPYVCKSTGEVMKHVRTVPATEREKLEKVLGEAYRGRILAVDSEKGSTFRFLG